MEKFDKNQPKQNINQSRDDKRQASSGTNPHKEGMGSSHQQGQGHQGQGQGHQGQGHQGQGQQGYQGQSGQQRPGQNPQRGQQWTDKDRK